MNNSKISENYLHVLANFVKNRGVELLSTSGYDQGPFIPYVFDNYENASIKVVYCGIDTYYWKSLESLKKAVNEGKLEDYLKLNSEAVNVDSVVSWGNKCSFWGTVARLQLMIRTGKYYNDITNLSEEELSIINEVGYSNLNSLELYKTFHDNRGVDLCDYDSFYQASELANSFTSIKTLLDSYHPDFLFILTWSDKDEVFEGLECVQEKEYYEDKFRAVYSIKGYKTKIIWSTHPSSFSFKQTNMEEMTKYLYDSYLKLTSSNNKA